ncbi:MAG TPA: carboxymuconolactone decarboxylase family protein [Pseudonocardia sp.]|jgi:4-carboxymuconolactone decarboxylase|uniref:carboxymuconolactone decarboxylase family protein n=1 Tax=Pseudonocardia sp. TaxID=60912 RepID=UPI002B4B8E1A|nr:carboxymuconolactone decarboxylase family protein [Pseudonocardia sp.]HLU53825.1 carboxymuconolactone decarboxylase family protein [Pseudonocardia sp.]
MSERRLRPLRPDELDAEQRAVYDALTDPPGRVRRAPDGSLEGPFDAMLRAPRSGAALQSVGAALRYRSALPERVRELATLQVAAHHRAQFEWFAHAPLAAAAGLPAALVEAVRTGGPVEPEDEAERAAAVAVAQLLTTGDVDDEAWAAVVGALGEAGAVELTTLVGYYSLLAMQMRVLRVPLPDGAEPVEFPA